jgi:hypothetical protein
MLLRAAPTILLAIVALASPQASYAQAPRSEPVSVVELFTSQGCSSCPPADALLKEYADRKDVVALTLPVDYWDYLGWKDTLASPKFTSRQRAYAKKRGDGEIYTPQVVVNGVKHVVGSRRADIDQAIEKTAATLATSGVPLKASIVGETLQIEIGQSANGDVGTGTIWIAVVQPTVTVEIRRGENTGKSLVYYNAVRELNPVGMWSAQPGKIELRHADVVRTSTDRCAVLLQRGNHGPIVGASWADPR